MMEEAIIEQMQRWMREHPDIVEIMEEWARIAPIYEDAQRIYRKSMRAMNGTEVITTDRTTAVP